MGDISIFDEDETERGNDVHLRFLHAYAQNPVHVVYMDEDSGDVSLEKLHCFRHHCDCEMPHVFSSTPTPRRMP